LWQAKANQVDRMLNKAVSGPVQWVDCHACRERLAEIRYEPDAVIAFEVMAPVRVEDGTTFVVVLERQPKPDQPMRVVRPPGPVAAFRCPTCSRDTTVNIAKLSAVSSGIAGGREAV